MHLRPRDRHIVRRGPRPPRIAHRIAFTLAVSGAIVALFLLRGFQPEESSPRDPIRLSAGPSPALSAALAPDAVEFEPAMVASIQDRGWVTVTVHVALLDRWNGRGAATLGNGDEPGTNLYWGALFGMETHFANAAGWRRAYTDDGDGTRTIRRVVFHRQGHATPAWQARGVTRDFDVYVLANAWPSSRIVDAMEQPLREAACGDTVTLPVDGRALPFGGESAIVGYVGRNQMLDEYWDPFARLGRCAAPRQIGVFYLCPRSAVVLHQPVIDRGLYSVLFTLSAATPEAYLVDGMLQALLSGELDDAFLSGAAAQYARYQKNVSVRRAASIFIR